MAESRKRQRTDTVANPRILSAQVSGPVHDLEQCIQVLRQKDPHFLDCFLLQLAQSQPNIASVLRLKYDGLLQHQRSRVCSFDHYSKSVWHTLNSNNTIRKIATEAGSAQNSFGTKQSGLETLRKIGKTICLISNDTLGNEVQQQFSHGGTLLEDAMLAIKMDELQQLADDYCVFEQLGDVIDEYYQDAEDSERRDSLSTRLVYR
ncbi:hypothetical protein K504DRAFT_502146 [Pleomassaria siparia CBS 279.74]|uniref:Uncharacterized protein n=1 Tax=Pleomassaria siparia CBS 279.74 TaxID=1314801 RepID=A0A6G1KAM8_9PLEO|nr:hypothetical protein K504DRAFT_502146 [Pleomassaria siparia CBS 279.74]